MPLKTHKPATKKGGYSPNLEQIGRARSLKLWDGFNLTPAHFPQGQDDHWPRRSSSTSVGSGLYCRDALSHLGNLIYDVGREPATTHAGEKQSLVNVAGAPRQMNGRCGKSLDLKILQNTPPWEWPHDADNRFVAVLLDDLADEADRVVAAELCGDFTVINEDLAEALLSVVRKAHEPETLRAQAAISLGPVLEYAHTEGFDDDDVPISQSMFLGIQESLHKLYRDTDVPKEVRRRVMEASVRAPQDWHPDAIRAAYSSDDEGWRQTAVFSMGCIRGFNEQILEALESADPEIHYQAVCAAGNWEVEAAWRHVVELVNSKVTDKPLRLAAIEAVASIRPQEAGMILADLSDSDDEDIVEAIYDAMGLARGLGMTSSTRMKMETNSFTERANKVCQCALPFEVPVQVDQCFGER